MPWSDDEFWQGVWWVPDDDGGLRNASPSECAAEIQRLRGMLDHFGDLAKRDHDDLQSKIDKLKG